MAVGQSGRIVLEIDPELKRELYSCLSSDGMSLRTWFLEYANKYLDARAQLNLDLNIESSVAVATDDRP